ncbi:LysR family transcriptional regulator [Listeria sp. PSOL-1]|uniref:LysR family transcriptional regulator n=1 Tax=Listeria sp. PSOL-1 TaxID=1844999 RepID=UPI0013D57A54|nr:LysR family transcriptional regulator [Listeria sp. PSOL-1]
MNLLHLRYFQVVASTQNITKAADQLYISQPALSKTIHQLEEELDISLFDRNGKNISLNSFGKLYLSYINEGLALIDQGKTALQELNKGSENSLSLYTPVGSLLLPNLVKVLKQKFPEIQITLIQHSEKNIHNVCYDLAITTNPSEADVALPLLTESLHLAIPTNHPLSERNIVTLADLNGQNFIGLTKHTPLRKTIDTYLEKHDVKCHYIFESDDPATVRGLIESGLGIGFIPSILWKGLLFNNLKFIKVAAEPLQRSIYLCWNKQIELTFFQKLLIEEFQAFYSNLQRE